MVHTTIFAFHLGPNHQQRVRTGAEAFFCSSSRGRMRAREMEWNRDQHLSASSGYISIATAEDLASSFIKIGSSPKGCSENRNAEGKSTVMASRNTWLASIAMIDISATGGQGRRRNSVLSVSASSVCLDLQEQLRVDEEPSMSSAEVLPIDWSQRLAEERFELRLCGSSLSALRKKIDTTSQRGAVEEIEKLRALGSSVSWAPLPPIVLCHPSRHSRWVLCCATYQHENSRSPDQTPIPHSVTVTDDDGRCTVR